MRKVFRISAALLAALLLIISFPAHASYSDTAGHWAEAAIAKWSDYGVIRGSNVSFRPTQPITRAEMATVVANMLRLELEAENSYKDVPADAWYTSAVLKCVKAGILTGDGNGIMRPTDNVTRQEAMVMLGRALHIDEASAGSLEVFTDGGETASWAKGYVAALVALGIVHGVKTDMLSPAGRIDRASVVTIVENAVSIYITKDGVYTLSNKDGGITVVAAKDVTLQGSAGGMVLVAPGAAGGKLTVNGTVGNLKVAADSVSVDVPDGTVVKLAFSAEGGSISSGSFANVRTVSGSYELASETQSPTPDSTPDPAPAPGSGEDPDPNPNTGGGLIDGEWTPLY